MFTVTRLAESKLLMDSLAHMSVPAGTGSGSVDAPHPEYTSAADNANAVMAASRGKRADCCVTCILLPLHPYRLLYKYRP